MQWGVGDANLSLVIRKWGTNSSSGGPVKHDRHFTPVDCVERE